MKIFLLILMTLWTATARAEEAAISWRDVYSRTQEAYVNEISIEDLAVAALKGLDRVDKNLKLANDGSRLSLYYRGKVIKVAGKPQDKNNAAEWERISNEIVAAAVEKSATAAENDFKIDDLMAQSMVRVMDKDSKFYGSQDEAEGYGGNNRRTFAAREENGLLYVKIGAFNKQTLAELKKTLAEYGRAPALVIDLKGCPGGMAGEAILAAGLFIDGGIIASTGGKNKTEETYYTADGGDSWHNKPVFVLVDAATASAAEIFAAALQEQGRAKIIGTATTGKGTMQKLIALGQGSVLAVTNGFFKTPSGRGLNGSGVQPDICTFEESENTAAATLAGRQNRSCAAENRENSGLEFKLAEFMLQNGNGR